MRSLLASGHVHEVLSEERFKDEALAKVTTCGGGTFMQLSRCLQGLGKRLFKGFKASQTLSHATCIFHSITSHHLANAILASKCVHLFG